IPSNRFLVAILPQSELRSGAVCVGRATEFRSAGAPMTSISTSLLARLQSQTQQEDAWARLLDLYGPLVYSRCRRASIPPQDVGDVAQEVFLEVMKSIGEFRRDRPGDTFRGWMARITQRRIADYWRRRQRIPEGEAAGGSIVREQLSEVPDHH